MKSGHGTANAFSVLDKGNDHSPSTDWCVLLRTPPRPMHTANGAASRTLSTPTHARCWAPPCPNACAVAAPRQALRSSPSGSAIITSGRRDGPPESAMGAAGTFSTVGSIRELRVVPQHVGFVSGVASPVLKCDFSPGPWPSTLLDTTQPYRNIFQRFLQR